MSVNDELITAIRKGDLGSILENVTKAISQGADVNFKDSTYHCTAIFEALFRYDEKYSPFPIDEVVELLIKHGADLNEKYDLKSPLYVAVDRDIKNVVKILINHGADVNSHWCGKTVLIEIMCQVPFDDELVELLISKGADVNATYTEPGFEKNPLGLALAQKNDKIVKLLISKGADPNKALNNETIYRYED